MAIADLQKQLYKKDKELKKATRSVITIDKKNLITCFSVLGIILVLAIIIAASVINNNSSPSMIPEQNITAEAPITVTEASTVSDESVSDDTDSTNTKVDREQSIPFLIYVDEIEKELPPLPQLIMFAILFLTSSFVIKVLVNMLHRM